MSDIIFASSDAQREFWLGRNPSTPEAELWDRYGGTRSPAFMAVMRNEIAKVGVPDAQRLCWIKGDPTFDALIQASIDPAGRAYVGPSPPVSATPSQTIKAVTVRNALGLLLPRLK